MNRNRLAMLAAALVLVTLSACIPVSVPGLRHIDGQTWSSRFNVDVQAGGSTIRLPVQVSMTFRQQLTDVTADATLEYDAGIFRLQTGGLVQMSGNLGFDDSLQLDSPSGALSFDGRFVGDRLVGTVAIAGVLPVADVTFTRTR
ncbi:MAG TPA: hypothetical protein VFF08_11245 [Trueperaceae bacterium]|nr:hypothetical protein [Trueperaceae bacterium]